MFFLFGLVGIAVAYGLYDLAVDSLYEKALALVPDGEPDDAAAEAQFAPSSGQSDLIDEASQQAAPDLIEHSAAASPFLFSQATEDVQDFTVLEIATPDEAEPAMADDMGMDPELVFATSRADVIMGNAEAELIFGSEGPELAPLGDQDDAYASIFQDDAPGDPTVIGGAPGDSLEGTDPPTAQAAALLNGAGVGTLPDGAGGTLVAGADADLFTTIAPEEAEDLVRVQHFEAGGDTLGGHMGQPAPKYALDVHDTAKGAIVDADGIDAALLNGITATDALEAALAGNARLF